MKYRPLVLSGMQLGKKELRVLTHAFEFYKFDDLRERVDQHRYLECRKPAVDRYDLVSVTLSASRNRSVPATVRELLSN